MLCGWDVVEFLRKKGGFRCSGWHGGNQGNVIKGVFLDGRADVGIVDEDPGKPHHPLRDALEVVCRMDFVDVRRRKGRHLLILKPELEECFLASARRVGFESKLSTDARRLRRMLGKPGGSQHEDFRSELEAVHDLSRRKKIATFITELVDAVKRMEEGRHE